MLVPRLQRRFRRHAWPRRAISDLPNGLVQRLSNTRLAMPPRYTCLAPMLDIDEHHVVPPRSHLLPPTNTCHPPRVPTASYGYLRVTRTIYLDILCILIRQNPLIAGHMGGTLSAGKLVVHTVLKAPCWLLLSATQIQISPWHRIAYRFLWATPLKMPCDASMAS